MKHEGHEVRSGPFDPLPFGPFDPLPVIPDKHPDYFPGQFPFKKNDWRIPSYSNKGLPGYVFEAPTFEQPLPGNLNPEIKYFGI